MITDKETIKELGAEAQIKKNHKQDVKVRSESSCSSSEDIKKKICEILVNYKFPYKDDSHKSTEQYADEILEECEKENKELRKRIIEKLDIIIEKDKNFKEFVRELKEEFGLREDIKTFEEINNNRTIFEEMNIKEGIEILNNLALKYGVSEGGNNE